MRPAGPALPPSRWDFAALTARADPQDDLVGAGGDLAPGTLLSAYAHGLFPMGLGAAGGPPWGWFSPVRRGVLLPGDFHVSRSLRRAARGFTTTVDLAFDEVVGACADPGRPGAWITTDIQSAYRELYLQGWAHSVEVWDGQGDLVGGLYGVGIGSFFAGESMFHRVRDSSKVAMLRMVRQVHQGESRSLIDVQWSTGHLASLGVRELDREDYLARLPPALSGPAPWPDSEGIL